MITLAVTSRKQQILDALQDAIDHADLDAMAFRRQQKRGLWGHFYPTRDVPLHQGVMCLYIKADVPLHQGAT